MHVVNGERYVQRREGDSETVFLVGLVFLVYFVL